MKNGTRKGGALSGEEYQWSMEALKKLGKAPTAKNVVASGLLDEHNKKFDNKIGAAGLYYRLRNMYYKSPGKGKGRTFEKIADKANFLLYIKNVTLAGFETEDELKACMEQNKIIGNVTVFRKANVDIKYQIKIA